MAGNTLYFGDNLDILRDYIADQSVDLIYLDPPFNSNRSYNLLFKDASGTPADAQITAFDDTWHWGDSAERALLEVSTGPRQDVASVLTALVDALGRRNDMTAYLTMMTIRLLELHRVLKPTGSLYLHCDPTASHYLKVVMDAIFGKEQFRTEIAWKRSSAHSDTKQGRRQHGRIHDIILFYTKGSEWTWNPVYTPYDREYVDAFYRHVEPVTGRRYQLDNLTAAKPGGDTSYEWPIKRKADGEWQADLEGEHGRPLPGWQYDVARPYRGRYWAYSRENMIAFAKEGRLYHTRNGVPRYKRYLDEMPGVPLQDLWDDIPPAFGNERLGYPTQKPVALLERIIAASSNPSDIVLDPFCGCGTTVTAAQKLDRRWIGIDITHLSIALMRARLRDTFGDAASYQVIGQPADLQSAHALAAQDRFQFESWVISLLAARPSQDKRGADQGLDGVLYFRDDTAGKAKKAIIQVKSGHVQSSVIRDLTHVVNRDKAAMGLLVTLEPPSQPMLTEALAAGYYHSPGWNRDYQRIQICTVDALLAGRKFDMPPTNITYEQASRFQAGAEQGRLL